VLGIDFGGTKVALAVARRTGEILPALRRRLEQAVPFPPGLVPAHFVLDAPLRGAIALAADACAMPKQPVGR
jgi:hypothetical protein